jgi:hypothetical protein
MDLACGVEKNLDYYYIMVDTGDFARVVITLGCFCFM